MNYKKTIKLTILILIIIGSALFTYKIKNRFVTSEYSSIELENKIKRDSTKIGIIGDSWVAGSKFDTYFEKEGLKVYSSGEPGANTLKIYNNLFLDSKSKFSSNFILKEPISKCIIVAGVNDFATQLGPKYYSTNIVNICKLLINNGIEPVIVTLPSFNMDGYIKESKINNQINIYINSYITNGFNNLTNINSYRDSMIDQIKNEDLSELVTIIDYSKFCDKYSDCTNLYKDNAHLNEQGTEMLALYILNNI